MEFPSGSFNERYPEQIQTFNSSPIAQYNDSDMGILTPTSHKSHRKYSSSGVMSVGPKVSFRIRSKVPQVGRIPRNAPSSSRDDSPSVQTSKSLKADSFLTLHPVGVIHRTIKSSYKQRLLSSPISVRPPNTPKHASTSGKWLPGSNLPLSESLPLAPVSPASAGLINTEVGLPSSHTPSDAPIGSILSNHSVVSKHSFDRGESPWSKHGLLYSATSPQGSLLGPTSPAQNNIDNEEYINDEMMEHLAPRSEHELMENLSRSLAETSAHHACTHLTRRPRTVLDPQFAALEQDILTETLLHLYEGGPADRLGDPMRQDPFDEPTRFLPDQEMDNHLLELYEGAKFAPDSDLDTALLALYEGEKVEEDSVSEIRNSRVANYPSQSVSLQEVGPDIWSSHLPLTPPCQCLVMTYRDVPQTSASNKVSRSNTV